MQLKLFPLKILIATTATASILLSATVIAADNSKEIDMSQLTCGEFLQMGRMETMMTVVWYSGWMAEKQGNFAFTPDRSAMSSQKDVLSNSCQDSSDDLVINKLQN